VEGLFTKVPNYYPKTEENALLFLRRAMADARNNKNLDKAGVLCIIDLILIEGDGVMTMKRCNFYLAEIQIKRLKAIHKKTGLPLSDILRRAIDDYWERFEKKAKTK
jgi:hypothetical protein